MNAGKLGALKNGPLFWIDSADSQPCIGTCGMSCWSLKVQGKLFHSGLPHRGINPIELGMLATQEIQDRFYKDFGRHSEEERYNFVVGSSLKPTQIECAKGSLNQIPPNCTISGDLRLVPFYDIHECRAKIDSYVEDMNNQMGRMSEKSPTPFANYVLEDDGGQGKLTLEWIGEGENGIACSLVSEGNNAITDATKDVKGSVSPYSITGSLPLVRYLQDNDFDVQIAGYGLSSRYHADNEFAELSDFKQALQILARVIGKLN